MLKYVIISAITGLIASFVVITLGASLWMVMATYSFVGSTALIFVPALQVAVGNLKSNRPKTERRLQAEARGRSALMTANQGSPSKPVLRILAVDDDPLILDLVSMIAGKSESYEVIPALSGIKALDQLADGHLPFGALLLDIDMPGMNGVELCQRIRKIPAYCETPIIILTGLRDVQNITEAFLAGATTYITKPFDVGELQMRLQFAYEMMLSRLKQKSAQQDVAMQTLKDVSNEAGANLITPAALSNYLGQLPQDSLADVQVFAINVDAVSDTRFPDQHSTTLLADVAVAAIRCFDADKTVMAYADDSTLIIATSVVNALLIRHIEVVIERHLMNKIPDPARSESIQAAISIGGPVQPQPAREKRSETAIAHAMRLAENRAMSKQRSLKGAGLSVPERLARV